MEDKKHGSEMVKSFHHPYQPYDIQNTFMLALYDCIDQRKVGIFESPTGTGKSLSLICGSLTWLRDHKRKTFDDSLAAADIGDDPEWMREHARAELKSRVLQNRVDLEKRLEAIRRKEFNIRDRYGKGEPIRKRRKVEANAEASNDDDEQFLLDDYNSDDDIGKIPNNHHTNDLGLSSETQALMRKLGLPLATDLPSADVDEEVEDELKIYFCSRTHSQLTQFVGELRRVEFPSAYPDIDDRIDQLRYPVETLKHITLASRKNLCINDKVLALRHTTAINERCMELQETKTPPEKRCQYLPKKENQALELDFQHHALARIRDIEDLSALGKKIGICPYYATRPAMKPSEVVTLPYQLLLQKSAREALGISLKNNVVIIDEAHNLMDVILGMYTVEISLAQLHRAREQLIVYLQRFRNRLKGKNRVYITQTVRLLDSMTAYMDEWSSDRPQEVQAADLLAGKGVDQINLYKLMDYLQESKLARKVQGYTSHASQHGHSKKTPGTAEAQVSSEPTMPVLTHIQSFLLALTNPATEGRFFFAHGRDAAETKLKYLLLDPSEHFREVVDTARAVILAGGTMSPMEDYMQQLVPQLEKSRLTTLSCGHVIPPSNLFVSHLAKDYTGADLDFTFASRNSAALISNLGESLLRILTLIPDGVVVFFPSYGYLEQVVLNWKRSASGKVTIWSCLEKLKPIFVDGQATSLSADDVLAQYSATIKSGSGRGALLLSVIGGKLSEGINFSDSLGRCVIVVGLPYPNPNAPEWKAKMEYIEQNAIQRGKVRGTASREFAENVCMRAVNQAIGRAVRHKDDWAAILLFDRRYEQGRIRDKLPKWVRTSQMSNTGANFATLSKELRQFFVGKTPRGPP